ANTTITSRSFCLMAASLRATVSTLPPCSRHFDWRLDNRTSPRKSDVVQWRLMATSSGRVRPAFSLLELLVVIAIIVLIIALLMPSLVAARIEAQRTVCLANLHQLAVAALTYSQDDSKAQCIAAPMNANTVALIDALYDYGGTSASLDDPNNAAMSV